MIAIVDYERGNLASVANRLNHLGAASWIARSAEDIRKASGVILPGVGSFDDAAVSLRTSGLAEAICEAALSGKPFLGICLGMQLLFDRSEEGGETGLGILPGVVRRFHFADGPARGLKVPHMGWNELSVTGDPLLEDKSLMYFVHSYYCIPADKSVISASCEYGGRFAAAVHQDNIHAVQFHPEKSGAAGLELLRRFSLLCGAPGTGVLPQER